MFPVTLLTLCYTAGILLALLTGGNYWVFAASTGIAFLFAFTRSGTIFGRYALYALLFSFGAFNFSSRFAAVSPYDLRLIVPSPPEIVSIRGVLTDPPALHTTEQDGRTRNRFLSKLSVSAITRQEQIQPAAGTVLVTTPGLHDAKFYEGRSVEIKGVLKIPSGATAPGLFDYRAYLYWHRTFFMLQAESTNDWHFLDASNPPPPPLSDKFLKWGQKTLALGLPEEDEALRLVWAMALGLTMTLAGEVAEPFMRTGTMHIFAISGLHITLISYILVTLLRFIRVPRWAAGAISIPLIWFYTAATGWQPSAIRSAIMSTVVIGGWIAGRPNDLLNSLAVSALIILIWQPEQVFQASFQLSFFVVFSMALLLPMTKDFPVRFWRGDPFLPLELHRRSIPERVALMIIGVFATPVAAWLGSLPLVAYYFHLVTPVSLLANPLIVPLSSLTLLSSVASLLVGGWFPGLAILFNHASWFLMKCIMVSSEWMQHWSWGNFYLPALSVPQCVAFYILLACLVLAALRRWRLAAVLGLPCVAFIGFAFWQENGSTIITVLPSSAGSIVIDAPGKHHDVLIDFSDKMSVRHTVSPFLRARGFNSLTRAVVTTADVRHLSGAELILKDFQLTDVWKITGSFRSSAYKQFLDELPRAGVKVHELDAGDQWDGWEVLHPGSKQKLTRAVDKALVLTKTISGVKVLFLSCLGIQGQRALLDSGANLQADIVVAAPPGTTDEPLSRGLLERIQPQIIVLATAEYPATLRGSRGLRERMEQARSPIFYTSDSGAVTLNFSSSGCEIKAMSAHPTRVVRGRGR